LSFCFYRPLGILISKFKQNFEKEIFGNKNFSVKRPLELEVYSKLFSVYIIAIRDNVNTYYSQTIFNYKCVAQLSVIDRPV